MIFRIFLIGIETDPTDVEINIEINKLNTNNKNTNEFFSFTIISNLEILPGNFF